SMRQRPTGTVSKSLRQPASSLQARRSSSQSHAAQQHQASQSHAMLVRPEELRLTRSHGLLQVAAQLPEQVPVSPQHTLRKELSSSTLLRPITTVSKSPRRLALRLQAKQSLSQSHAAPPHQASRLHATLVQQAEPLRTRSPGLHLEDPLQQGQEQASLRHTQRREPSS